MENKTLTIKKGKNLPYNYSLYPIEKISKEALIEKADTLPIEYCEAYNATLFVRPPYKKVVEY